MSLAQSIAKHLPFLRRYSRALSGSQSLGDSHVKDCLTAVVADARALPDDLELRVALYRVFHRTWQSSDAEAVSADSTRTGMDQKLRRLTPRSRQALLLTAMESFNRAETAQILDCNEETVDELLRGALRDMAKQPRTKVLIIEDEPIISLDLRSIMQEMGHEVTAIATTYDEALIAARRTRPGLVLADIKLADGSSGIDAARSILDEGEVPVVFITAYPERLLTGERPEPTFLVTKPFIPETVRATVSQALFLA